MVFRNSSTQPITSPKVYYYFTTEGGKVPVVEDYYTPSSDVWIELISGSDYRLVYSFDGVTLMPGDVVPNTAGSVVALHYADGSAWDKSNDYSQPSSDVLELSRQLVVVDGSGEVVGGTEPETEPPGELECEDLAVYVRDSQLFDPNITTPRWYLTNQGDSELDDFEVRYHFSTESGLTPQLEDYYSPDCSLALVHVGGSDWYAACDYTGGGLAPGATFPNTDGVAFSLHYAGWSYWNKTNDGSNPNTTSFVVSTGLSIARADGTLLCDATN